MPAAFPPELRSVLGAEASTRSLDELVRREVSRQLETRGRPAVAASTPERQKPAEDKRSMDFTSDDAVLALMRKMRVLAQADQFRVGRRL
jgi:hypothetical protein